MEKGSSLLDVIAFSNELEETLGRAVDMAYEDYMSDRFRQRVERDRLLILKHEGDDKRHTGAVDNLQWNEEGCITLSETEGIVVRA